MNNDVTANGYLSVNRPTTSLVILNATGATTNLNAQVQFLNGGTPKYQLGVNVYTGSDYFDLYSNVGGILAMRMSPAGAMNIGGAFVAGGSITANGWVVASSPTTSLVNISQADAGVGSKNWVLMNNNTVFGIYAYDDGLATSQPAMQVGRSGINVNFVTLVTSNVQRLFIDNVGVLFVGNTTTALGASAGEIVIGNGKSLKGATASNTLTVPLIGVDAFDHIVIGGQGGSTLVRIGAQALTSMPAASVNNGGGIMVDSANQRLCYWAPNGSRYWLAGTAF